MTNPVKGEVELNLSDGRKLVLVANFQSRVAAEGAYGKPYRLIVRDAGEEYLGAIQALFFGLLKSRQPGMTLEEVGDLIDGFGDEIMDGAEKAMNLAAPEGKEDANPPKPRRGKNSGANGAKPT